ncbi:MAG TPA: adenylate/guanylate cyclase domain-containing protein [Dehalococcoidia bacterium]
MALLDMPRVPFSHILLEWQIPEMRRWYEQLSEQTMLVRYDARGLGLSDRGVHDFTLDSLLLDVEAVADRLELNRFALLGNVISGAAAIAFAARFPERVSHLLLWSPYARGVDFFANPQLSGLFALLDKDWSLLTETVAHSVVGWSQGAPARRFASLIRESVSRETWQAYLEAFREVDVTQLLGEIRAPILVMHRRLVTFPDMEGARDVASRNRNATLRILEGASAAPYLGDVAAALDAVNEFLGVIQERETPSAPEPPSGTAAILFADIVDSTALTERLGDTAFRDQARDLDTALRAIIRDNAGTTIEGKLLGDGVLAVFTSARQAIEAALACARAGDKGGLPLHLGLHAGDVIRESDPDGRSNVYGGAVNIASRISGLSAPGEVLVSETVRSLARTSAGVRFEDRGEHSLKGIDDPVRVWAVREGV